MKVKVLITLSLIVSFNASAAFNNCIGVYVGRIAVDRQIGTHMVVLMNKQTNKGGSYWVNFSGWDKDAKKEALSLLMAAKMSQHRVDVYTTAQDKCSIGTPGQTFKEIHLSTNP